MVLLPVGAVDFNWFVFSCLVKSLTKLGICINICKEVIKTNVTASNFRALFLNLKHFL